MSALNTGNDHLGECVDNHTCLNNIPLLTLGGHGVPSPYLRIFVPAGFLRAKTRSKFGGVDICVNQELVEQAGKFPTNSSL